MLEWIRVNKRWAQLIMALLILPFAFAGMQGYLSQNARGIGPAQVGGTDISQAEFERAIAGQVEKLRASLGEKADASMLDTPELRHAVLEQLIDQKVALNGAMKARINTPDDLLRRVIASEPSLQDNGKFSLERYRQLIAAQGMTERDFETRIRGGLATDQLVSVPAQTARVPSAAAGFLGDALGQKRTIQVAMISADKEAQQVEPTEEQISAYYEANKRLFQIPETVTIEYLVLDAASVGSKIDIAEADLHKFYEQNQSRYVVPEQRSAAHILVAVAPGASPDDIAKAERKANELLTKVKAAPATFAQVARDNSDDPGSRTAGGDLGSFARGAMVKPFEDAVFSMQPGQISSLVRTDFGFHIIRLNSVSGGTARSFAEVRPEVEQEVRRQLGKQRFAEVAEQFGNLVYEQAESLKPAAERLGLTIQRAEKLSRNGGPGVLGERRLLDAVFSDDAINARHNTAAIDIGADRLVAAHVVEHVPAQTEALAAVRPKIVEAVKRQEGQARAIEKGRTTLQALRGGETPQLSFGASQETDRLAPTAGLSGAALTAIFAVDGSKLPAYAGVELPGTGYAVYRITAVTPGEAQSDRNRAIGAQYEQTLSVAEAGALIAGLRAREKVSIHLEKRR